MQTSATNRKLRVLLTGIRDKSLIPNPHFQRRLVWSNLHKVRFLETVLDGLPFPEIFIAAGDVDSDTGDGTELIVDGQQRVTTLHQYFTASPDLRLKSNSVRPYAELEEAEKRAFLEYEVVVRDLGPLSEEDTRDIFQRINSTKYSLNAMEVNNSRFDGALKSFAERTAGAHFFESNDVFSNLDGRRMNDVRFVLTVIITMMSGYFNRDDELEKYLEHYNDEFSEENEIAARLTRTFEFIESANFDSKCRLWQKADLLTAIVETDRILEEPTPNLSAETYRARIMEFYDQVESVTSGEGPYPPPDAEEYYRRVRSGVNDRTSRVVRAATWRARVLDEPVIDQTWA